MVRSRFVAGLLAAALVTGAAGAGARPDDVAALQDEAARLDQAGRFREAIALQERALAALERSAAGTLDLARAANNLGVMYDEIGELGRAEDRLLQALEIKRKLRGPDDPDVARTEENLAGLFDKEGNYRRSELLHRDALRIMKKAFGDEHPNVAICLNNLGHFHQLKREYDQAEPLLTQALAIFQKALGPEHPHVASAMLNLAELAGEKGDLRRAEELYLRTIAMLEKTLGREHPDVASAIQELGGIQIWKKDYAAAESSFTRALALVRKGRNADDLDVATILHGISWAREARGDFAGAVKAADESGEARERNLTALLSRGMESELADVLERFRGESDATISLHQRSAPRDPAAARVALSTILRRKARVLDALYGWAALRGSPKQEDRALLDRYIATRSRLATLLYAEDGAGSVDQRLAEAPLVAELEQLELALQRRSVEIAAAPQAITIPAVQAAIPEGAALVEIVAYAPFDPRASDPAKGFGKVRYAAYVLRHRGEVGSADLGETAPIDDAAIALRRALANPRSTDVRALSRALDERLMQPVAKLLGDATEVMIAPDGPLALVPFGALTAPDNRYRLETLAFTYLATGRDLLRAPSHATAPSGDVVIAAPDFGDARPAAPVPADVEPWGIGRLRFGALPGTAGEATAISRLLRKPTVLTGAAATETALKAVHGPRILHVATHGFFLAGDAPPAPASGRGLTLDPGSAVPAAPGKHRRKGFTSLLRAGVALAGANAKKSGDDDGLLSGFELSGLDLTGTKLVVFSACETGIGDPTLGDGIHGLRRALSVAGAETQVISLWKVDDEATRDLMVGYYEKLAAGAGRSEALRQAELGMLADARRAHPFYWAAFIPSGSSASLDGAPVAPPRAATVRAPPGGQRGCGCGMEPGGDVRFWWALAFVTCLVTMARGTRHPSRVMKKSTRRHRSTVAAIASPPSPLSASGEGEPEVLF